MHSNTKKHHRRSIRLRHYDYSGPGVCFITICTFDKICIFGHIEEDKMRLNGYGRIAFTEWLKTPVLRDCIKLDEFVIMPNHFHGILFLHEHGRGAARRAPTFHRNQYEGFGKPVSGSLPTITRSYKSAVTKHINEMRNTPGRPVWQRNYFEHIVRNDNELCRFRDYIITNPLKWELDREHPDNRELYNTRKR